MKNADITATYYNPAEVLTLDTVIGEGLTVGQLVDAVRDVPATLPGGVNGPNDTLSCRIEYFDYLDPENEWGAATLKMAQDSCPELVIYLAAFARRIDPEMHAKASAWDEARREYELFPRNFHRYYRTI